MRKLLLLGFALGCGDEVAGADRGLAEVFCPVDGARSWPGPVVGTPSLIGVGFTTPDGSTGVASDGAVFEVIVESESADVASVAERLAAGARILAWPSRGAVPARAEAVNLRPEFPGSRLFTVRVTPEARLEGGTYALAIPPLRAGEHVIQSERACALLLEDGSPAARFEVGGTPRLLSATLSRPSVLRFTFSEEVAQGTVTATVSQGGSELACRPLGNTSGVDCPEIDPAAPITLEVRGARSVRGPAVPDVRATFVPENGRALRSWVTTWF